MHKRNGGATNSLKNKRKKKFDPTTTYSTKQREVKKFYWPFVNSTGFF